MSDKSLDNIRIHKELLNILSHSKTKYKKAIIEKADKKLILAICDIIYNILNGNVNIDSETKNQLQKHKIFLRPLIEKASVKKKRKILQQKGGNILGIVLPALISAVASFL